MLQRIQSVFLGITGIMMFAMIFTTLWVKSSPDGVQTAQLSAFSMDFMKSGEVAETSNTIYLAVLGFLCSALAFGSMFSFKNRMLQIKMNMFNSLLMTVTLLLSVFKYSGAQEFVMAGVSAEEAGAAGALSSVEGLGLGFYAIVIAMFANLLANRFIKKDEELVRSADRLR